MTTGRYLIEFKQSADRAMNRLPEYIQRRLVRAIEALGHNPRPPGAVKLQGEENTWRIRIGDYRVLYDVNDKRLTVLVVRVAHRKDAYRGK